jgi:chloramphenicol 3-O phosphotransferase
MLNFPQVIILNGCSSAGKTTLARALQQRLPRQYLNFSLDSVLNGLPPSDLAALQLGEPIQRRGHDFAQLVRAYHYAIPGLLQAGCPLILDNAWCERAEKRELLTELAGYRILLVGLHCDLAELQQRELARGDRPPGMAQWEYSRVHQEISYDIELYTTGISAEMNADKVYSYIQDGCILNAAIDTLENLNMLG